MIGEGEQQHPEVAEWARNQGWLVVDDTKGDTRFSRPDGAYVARYPATPSNRRRRVQDLLVALRREGLLWPPPSKAEQRSARRRARQQP